MSEFLEKAKEYFATCQGVKYGVFWNRAAGCSSRLDSFCDLPLGYFETFHHASVAAEICERMRLKQRGLVWTQDMQWDPRK